MPASYPAEFRRRAIALVKSGWSVTKTAHDLYVFGRIRDAGSNVAFRYVDVEAPLQLLLDDFGPPKKSTPAFPFRRLANDGLWVITTRDGHEAKDEPASLRRLDAIGQLESEFAASLIGDPTLLVRCASPDHSREFPRGIGDHFLS